MILIWNSPALSPDWGWSQLWLQRLCWGWRAGCSVQPAEPIVCQFCIKWLEDKVSHFVTQQCVSFLIHYVAGSPALMPSGLQEVCVCVSWCLSELIKVCLSTIWRDKAQGFLVYRCLGMNTFCHIPFILVLLITFSASRPLHHSLVPHSASCQHFFVLCVLCSCHHYFLFLLSVSF